MHLTTYAAPVTKNMVHFNKLTYYALPSLPTDFKVPDWLSVDLGIFAGRLYLNFDEYAPLVEYIQGAISMGWDWEQEGNNSIAKYFTYQPIDFLHEWLITRRRGQDIQHTPMGYICQGRSLHENHPFFTTRVRDLSEIVPPTIGGAKSSGQFDEADEDSDVEEDWELLDVGGARVADTPEQSDDESGDEGDESVVKSEVGDGSGVDTESGSESEDDDTEVDSEAEL